MSTDGWIDPYKIKPEIMEIVHGISQVGQVLDVVECWWTGDSWIVPSVRSHIVSTNIIRWKPKPEIPDYIKEVFQCD